MILPGIFYTFQMVKVGGDLDWPDQHQLAMLVEQLDHFKSVATLGWFKQLVFQQGLHDWSSLSQVLNYFVYQRKVSKITHTDE